MEKRQKQGEILSDDKMYVILVGPAAFSTIQNAGGTRIKVNPPPRRPPGCTPDSLDDF